MSRDFDITWFCPRKTNIFDNICYMMEKYADSLEELVMEKTGQLVEEKKKTDALLERMLPRFVIQKKTWRTRTFSHNALRAQTTQR